MVEKTRKELERDMKEIRIVLVIMIIGILILGFYGIYKGVRVEKLQDQLSECQDKVPICRGNTTIWTLKYNCDWSAIGKNYTGYYEFKNYKDYVEKLDFVTNGIHCEVLE